MDTPETEDSAADNHLLWVIVAILFLGLLLCGTAILENNRRIALKEEFYLAYAREAEAFETTHGVTRVEYMEQTRKMLEELTHALEAEENKD